MDKPDKIAGALSSAGTELYKDLLQPTVKPVGEILSYLPRTIRLFFKKWENWIIKSEFALQETAELLEERLDRLPPEKIVEPEAYVAIPALQQLSYSVDSCELRTMYANLLATSMNGDRKWEVHPAFVEIIRQLTPDEAKFLRIFSPDKENIFPVINVRLVDLKDSGFTEILRNFTDTGDEILSAPENTPTYLENLARLKIIDIDTDKFITNDEVYAKLEKNDKVTRILESVSTGKKAEINKGIFFLTQFGAQFLRVCV